MFAYPVTNPSAKESPYTRNAKGSSLDDVHLTLLEQALIRVDGMDERIEFVTTKTIAIVIRRIGGTRKRHEEKRLILAFVRSLSRKRRARIARLGAQFDGSRRVLIGKLTQWG